MKLPFFLALRELRRDWIAAICFVAALVGVLGPMLILLALKNGLIGNMVDRLVLDPANREVIAVGAGQHDDAFFEWLAQRPDIAFVTPSTRSINGIADGLKSTDTNKAEQSVPLIVTAPGDPLLGPELTPKGTIWISVQLAQKLGARAGSDVTIFIGREIDGRQETAKAVLKVIGIVPQERYSRTAIFMSLPDILAVEGFRDSTEITPETWMSLTSIPPNYYSSFRLYVQDLADLDKVISDLAAKGVEARPRAENALVLMRFRDSLNIIYVILACIAFLGFWSAMAANLRGMVERRRLAYSLLNLIGLKPHFMALIPLFQSLVLISTGIVFSFLLVVPVLALINFNFPGDFTDVVAELRIPDFKGTLLMGGLTALTAATWAMRAAACIKSEEVLRNA
jgi:putative ABC transport system permease protein